MSTDFGFSPAARFLVVAGAFVILVAGCGRRLPDHALFARRLYRRDRDAAFARAAPTRVAELGGDAVGRPGHRRIGSVLGILIAGSLDGFKASLPDYQDRLMLVSTGIWRDGWTAIGFHTSREILQAYVDPGKVFGMAGRAGVGTQRRPRQRLSHLADRHLHSARGSRPPGQITRRTQSPETSTERLQASSTVSTAIWGSRA
jgi:AI-2 transport protein TqsA